ncbi:hypothetical protein [Pseudomonas yamanorum]|uniref:hypothetical protein n=1 Tax=Pseudomonas yamanorum TaxID=515393 RepID=UPI003F750217
MSKFSTTTDLCANYPSSSPIPNSEDRRKLIIALIIEYFASGTEKKLKLKDLAGRAGISRQALDRYYGDLKPYINGKKNIAELANSDDEKISIHIQNATRRASQQHQAALKKINNDHDEVLKAAIDSHITTLMNDDLALYHSHTIRASLEQQTLHNAELKKQISALELKLALGRGNPLNPHRETARDTHKLIFNVDIEGISSKFETHLDIDSFEDKKDSELRTVREKLVTFSDTPEVRVVIFAERYLSQFNTFANRFVVMSPETVLIVRLPLFSRNEILNFTKHLPKQFKISVYIPYCSSDIEKRAQREFMFRNLITDETKAADNADVINIGWGFDEVVHFKIHQGD